MAAVTKERPAEDRGRAKVSDFPVNASTLAGGLAAIRILLGLTFLSNGLAKLFGFHRVAFGPVVGNLINREDARFILDVEVNKNSQRLLPLLGRITNDLIPGPSEEPVGNGGTLFATARALVGRRSSAGPVGQPPAGDGLQARPSR